MEVGLSKQKKQDGGRNFYAKLASFEVEKPCLDVTNLKYIITVLKGRSQSANRKGQLLLSLR